MLIENIEFATRCFRFLDNLIFKMYSMLNINFILKYIDLTNKRKMSKIKKYIQFIKENNMFQYNNVIDYTLLEYTTTDDDIIDLCEKANMLGVKSVCVLPKHVTLASEKLKNSKVLVCTVISFPEGRNTIEQKVSETNQVISDGADEVDMVLNYHKIKGNEFYELDYLVEEVSSLVHICHSNKNKNGDSIILKVIVESGLLTEEETKIATDICLEAEADFIKTSTGKSPIGAELNKIKIMYDAIKNVNSDMKIKASGGVRTADQINSMLGMVDRFGMGYDAVDKLNNIRVYSTSSY